MNDNIGTAIGLKQVERKVLLACGGWALLSLLVLGSGSVLQARPDEFVIVVSLLKIGSFLIATALCWRNAIQPDILSGRNVWQAIALGMACHALGDITVILWRSLWGISTPVSLGDIFYGVSYLFLAIGLLLAVLPRPVTLSLPQTLGISCTGIVGIVLASWINFYVPTVAALPNSTNPATGSTAGLVEPATRISDGISDASAAEAKGAAAGAIARSTQSAPAVIKTIEARLSGIASHLGLLYVVGDCALMVMAVALLVAFWGGSYSETWKLVALAGLCLYVADMLLIYQLGQGTYRQGAPWEIFWILSALLFGLSASVEHGVSTQLKQRTPGRQRL